MNWMEVAVAAVMAIGLAGIVIPVLPGSVLILIAFVVWASETGGQGAWIALAIGACFLVVGALVKYLVPGRRLRTAGIPNRTLLLAAVGAIVGFFVIPVIGAIAGFVLGIYLAEHLRLGSELAWPSTKHALRAVGLSIAIETAAACCAIITWGVAVGLT